MSLMHDTPTENGVHSHEAAGDETGLPGEFESAIAEESSAHLDALEPALNSQKGDHKAHKKKAGKKKLKVSLKEKKSSTKLLAGTFPMVALIDEQVRTSIPEELVARVKAAKEKKNIIGASYPYPQQMKKSDYEEEIELLQIELVKMQAWVKEVGERIVLIFEGRDAAGKGGTIQRFTENLNPRGAKVVVWPNLRTRNGASGIFRGISKSCPRKAKSSFLTAPGTTARASNM